MLDAFPYIQSEDLRIAASYLGDVEMLLYVDNDNAIKLNALRDIDEAYINDATLLAHLGITSTKKAIEAVSQASPYVITVTDHGLLTGDRIILTQVDGDLNEDINGVFDVTKLTDDTFELDGTTYTSGDWLSSTGYIYKAIDDTISLSYVSASNGNYLGTVVAAIALQDNTKYTCIVAASNYAIKFEKTLVARVRA